MSLQTIIRRARVRLTAAALAHAALRNAGVLLILLTACAVVRRTLGLDFSGAWTAPAVLVFFLAAVVETAARAPGRTAAALILDRAIVTHELFATALEMESAAGDIPREIRNRAAAAADDCDVRAALPIFFSPVLAAAAVALTAALLILSGESQPAAPAPGGTAAGRLKAAADDLESGGAPAADEIASRLQKAAGAIESGEPARAVEQILDRIHVRLETAGQIIGAVCELEQLGVSGIKDAVLRGDAAAASAAVSSAGRRLDRSAVSDVVDRLRKTALDPDLRARLAAYGRPGDLSDLAAVLALYAAGADAAALRGAREALEAVSSAMAVGNYGEIIRKPGTRNEYVAPVFGKGDRVPGFPIPSGPSAVVDVDSVPPRYRELVKRYFQKRG